MAFHFTHEMATVSNRLWAVASAVGAGVCLLVLIVIATVWTNPKSRCHLDRVSFRIVCYALATNMVFGIANTVGGLLSGPSFGCGFSIFIVQLTLHFSSFLLCSIAVNLFLVIVYRASGQLMEKFYIAGSFALSLVITIPPYVAGHWDVLEKDCWFTNDNRTQRLAWQIGTQLIWSGLSVVVEAAVSISVLVNLLQHRRRMNRVLSAVNNPYNIGSFTEPVPKSQFILVNSYKRIILRISLYPIASSIVNLVTIFTSITTTIGINSKVDYNILLLADFWYGGRAIAYAVLAATDPSLVRGLQVLFFHLRHGSDVPYKPTMSKSKSDIPYPQFEANVEVSVMQERSANSSKSNIELTGDYKAMAESRSLDPSLELRDLDSSASSVCNSSVSGQRIHKSAPSARPNLHRHSIDERTHLQLHDTEEEEITFEREL